MKKKDIEGLARELDSQNMVGYTRNFMDDFESAITKEIDIDVDKDWSGVLCLGMGGSGAGGMFLSTLADYSGGIPFVCLLYTSPSPRDGLLSRMPSSA